MRKPSSFLGQRGYFAMVQNSDTTDYLSLALLQAKTIKATQRINQYAIGVDEYTRSLVTDEHRRYIDHIIDIPWGDAAQSQGWKLANEWKAWWMTPFKETVKLDVDIVFTRDVSHWWDIMMLREVCIATRAYDYQGRTATSRAYRKLIDDNQLLDAYSGFTYFRYSRTSADFFQQVRLVFENWDQYRDHVLTRCAQDAATTDEAYAIAARIIGEERCYIPDSPMGFVHMKGAINGLPVGARWQDYLYHQWDGRTLMIGGYGQHYPVHYVDKGWGQELLKSYDRV